MAETEPEVDVNGTEAEAEDDSQEQDKKQKKQTRHDGGAADLERVTDYAEEKEISAANISSAVEQFGNQRSKENELRVAKEKELQKVQVKKEDIELIVSSMSIGRHMYTLYATYVPLWLDEPAAREQGTRREGAAGAERRCRGRPGGHH
ncbi:hypothetical protein KR222_003692 [Zaprionus bogoriensis]|nr:hypothetical protein KR222_003692 [Zaprionus bogoriensis]